jgi:hypothetical protein
MATRTAGLGGNVIATPNAASLDRNVNDQLRSTISDEVRVAYRRFAVLTNDNIHEAFGDNDHLYDLLAVSELLYPLVGTGHCFEIFVRRFG